SILSRECVSKVVGYGCETISIRQFCLRTWHRSAISQRICNCGTEAATLRDCKDARVGSDGVLFHDSDLLSHSRLYNSERSSRHRLWHSLRQHRSRWARGCIECAV